MAKQLSPYHPLNLMPTLKKERKSRPGETDVVPLLDYYQWMLIGNMTIGTPAQTFSVAFDMWSSDLSVIDVNATDDYDGWVCTDDDYCEYDGTYDDTDDAVRVTHAVSDKQLYNASASSTSATSNGKFTSDWRDTGVMVGDKINIGGLSANVSFGDITTVNSWIGDYPMDGILGLSPKPSNNSGMSNLLKQLSGSLALPVLTMHINRSAEYNYRSSNASSTSAQIVLGTNSLPQCNANNWKSINLNPQSADQYAPFVVNATAISSANSTGCNSHVQVNHPVWFVDGFYSMIVSHQVEELFVKASGAVFNQTSRWYTVADVSKAGDVNITLADGEVLTLKPQDYIVPYKGINYLEVYGWYREDDARYADMPMFIGQQWLNSRCLSYNINVNTLSITDALPNNGNPTTQ